MNPANIFDELASRVSQRPELIDDIGVVYQFDVDGEQGGSWVVDLKNAPGGVRAGAAADADCVITVSQDDLAGIIDGSVSPQTAFLMGRIKIAGNFMLATKLDALV
ncbi:MAG TPA: SCP2 sterol-binding domain-containing protein [Acidobacteriota bacterium]|nr:SCP2 sterol-binding domain-containing protein [Acidobacteriota bacterium]